VERGQLILLALAPVLPSAVFVAIQQPASWSFATAAFLVTLLFAYMTYLLAALPMLLAFKQFARLRWFHFALSGALGVLLVWAVPSFLVPGAWSPVATASSASVVDALRPYAVPCALAALTGIAVWFVGFRHNAA
jgi:hypothetical protein